MAAVAGGLTAAGPAAAAAVAALLTAAVTPAVSAALLRGGLAVPNYRGRPLATAGLALAAGLVPACLLAGTAAGRWQEVLLGLAVSCLAGWGGFVDDAAGRADPRGLAGHAAALRRGVLTGGALKGALLLAAGLVAAAAPEAPGAALVLVPLAAQAANCLDRRPGRAAKAALGAGALLAAAALGTGRPVPAFLPPLAGALAGFLPWDARQRCLLGDAGANLAGAGLGLAAALVLPPGVGWGAAAALGAFVLLADRVSVNAWWDRVTGAEGAPEGGRAPTPSRAGGMDYNEGGAGKGWR